MKPLKWIILTLPWTVKSLKNIYNITLYQNLKLNLSPPYIRQKKEAEGSWKVKKYPPSNETDGLRNLRPTHQLVRWTLRGKLGNRDKDILILEFTLVPPEGTKEGPLSLTTLSHRRSEQISTLVVVSLCAPSFPDPK